MQNIFEELMTDKAYIVDAKGIEKGPYKTLFGVKNELTFFDEKLEMDIEVGYKILRHMSNGKVATYNVLDYDFQERFHDIPPQYLLKIQKGNKKPTLIHKPSVQNITYNISDSQGFQAGNENTQNITDSFNELTKRIESSEATEEEKEEAKGTLRKVFENPLVSALLGGVLSGGVSLLG